MSLIEQWKGRVVMQWQNTPDFEKTCGYGSVTGIGGANCRCTA